ncbi:MAG: biotin--[acetyl-CoA-carboxylase] ligase [Polyangiaceae bacterium]|nr:biotin--[acetyl-CoA-carboxylase] ligase [Polyangiaceae bacterium]
MTSAPSNSSKPPAPEPAVSSFSKAGQYSPTWFDRPLFDRLRQERQLRWGRPLRLFDELGSTNDEALEAFRNQVPNGAVFCAYEQHSGRGRRGNAWHAPPGDSLALSLVLRLPVNFHQSAGLSLLVGLALCLTLEPRLSAPVSMKWPNDIMVNEKKLGGILVEGRFQGQQLGAIVGIGINTQLKEFPPHLEGRATSLRAQGASSRNTAHEPLMIDLLASLESLVPNFLLKGLESFHPEIQALNFLRGKSVWISDAQVENGAPPEATRERQEKRDDQRPSGSLLNPARAKMQDSALQDSALQDSTLHGTVEGITPQGYLELQTADAFIEVRSGHIEKISSPQEPPGMTR